jgi:hypothetical protein
LPYTDQHAIDEDGVIWRQQQIRVRHVVSERAPLDAHRGHGFGSRMRGQIYAPSADAGAGCNADEPA